MNMPRVGYVSGEAKKDPAGWGVAFFRGDRAHFMVTVKSKPGEPPMVRALCGGYYHADYLFEPGSYPRCKNCAKVAP